MAVEKIKRSTKQRKLIKEILVNTKCHPTADWVYEEARKVLPDISLGTVYRNLQVLLEENSIQELKYGKSFSRFDGNPDLHYHFVCDCCGEILDMDVPEQTANIIGLAENELECEIRTHRMEFYGVCPKCLAKAANKAAAL